MCAKWNKNYDPNVLMSRLEGVKMEDAQGKVRFKLFEYHILASVICSCLEFDHCMTEEDKRMVLREAVQETATKSRMTPNSLLRNICLKEKEFRRRPRTDFTLVTNLSVRFFQHLRPIPFRGATITFTKRAPKKFDRAKVEERARRTILGPLPEDYTWVRVAVSARSSHEAAHSALGALRLLRGIWNLRLNKRWSISFGGRAKPVNQVLLGPLHTLHRADGQLAAKNTWWYQPEYEGPAQCIDIQREWRQLKKAYKDIAERFRRSPHQEFIQECLGRYCMALDDKLHHQALVKLWSLLERMTGTQRERYDKLIKRMLFFLPNIQYHRQVLKYLKELRNRTVHSSEESDEIESSLYQLKSYVEWLLWFLIKKSEQFRNLQDMFKWMDSPTDLDALVDRVKRFQAALQFRRGFT